MDSAPKRHRKQFRKGDTPFAQALTQAIQDAGYPNKRVFAERLDVPRPTLTMWTRGRKVPSAHAMGRILEALQPSDEQLDALIEPWSDVLLRRVGFTSERQYRVSQRMRRPARTPLGQWIDRIADSRHWSINGLGRRPGVPDPTVRRWRRPEITPSAVAALLRHTQDGPLSLTEREQVALRQAIAQTLAPRAANRGQGTKD